MPTVPATAATKIAATITHGMTDRTSLLRTSGSKGSLGANSVSFRASNYA